MAGSGDAVVTFQAAGQVAELAERARAVPPVGRVRIEGPVETGWNTRDLRVTDPDGYRLVFTEPARHPQLTEAWKATFAGFEDDAGAEDRDTHG